MNTNLTKDKKRIKRTGLPDYRIFWGSVKPQGVLALRKEAENQTSSFERFADETDDQFAARVWACGFLFAREYYSEQIALRMAGWPEQTKGKKP
jgi:hypothetical protein